MSDETTASMQTMATVMDAIAKSAEPTGYDIRTALAELLHDGLDEKAFAGIKKQCREMMDQIEADMDYSIRDNLSSNLADFVANMADRAIEQLLAGNEKLMRQYLGCSEYGYTGRDHDHQVIHGVLSEHSPMTLRKKIVEAFPELLTTERVLDLESQLASLVKRVNELEAARQRLSDELRSR